MSSKLFSFLYFCRVFIAIASDTCYWIDGTEAANRFACFDTNKNGASMCCDEASSPFFSSCTGGICAYTYASGVQGLYDDGLSLWRDSCTDPTWRDPACVKMASCEDNWEQGGLSMNSILTCMLVRCHELASSTEQVCGWQSLPAKHE